MKFWRSKEKRQVDYTQQSIERMDSVIQGGLDDGTQLAAVQFAGTLVGNAFANAKVVGLDNIDASVRQSIGTQLILRGEVVLVFYEGRWLPVGEYTVKGSSPLPEQWNYRLDLSAPDLAEPLYRVGSDVIHVRYAPDPKKHWQGVPAWKASKTVKTALVAEDACSESARTPVMTLTSLGSGFGSNVVEADTKRELSAAFRKRSKVFIVKPETTAAQPSTHRLEPKVDPGLTELRRQSQLAILGAIGVPMALFSTDSEGTGRRVALSQLTLNCLQPLGYLVSAEFQLKLGIDLQFDFSDLLFSDVQGKARAVANLVKAGVSIDEAMMQVGLE